MRYKTILSDSIWKRGAYSLMAMVGPLLNITQLSYDHQTVFYCAEFGIGMGA
jgi:hypothetical protein